MKKYLKNWIIIPIAIISLAVYVSCSVFDKQPTQSQAIEASINASTDWTKSEILATFAKDSIQIPGEKFKKGFYSSSITEMDTVLETGWEITSPEDIAVAMQELLEVKIDTTGFHVYKLKSDPADTSSLADWIIWREAGVNKDSIIYTLSSLTQRYLIRPHYVDTVQFATVTLPNEVSEMQFQARGNLADLFGRLESITFYSKVYVSGVRAGSAPHSIDGCRSSKTWRWDVDNCNTQRYSVLISRFLPWQLEGLDIWDSNLPSTTASNDYWEQTEYFSATEGAENGLSLNRYPAIGWFYMFYVASNHDSAEYDSVWNESTQEYTYQWPDLLVAPEVGPVIGDANNIFINNANFQLHPKNGGWRSSGFANSNIYNALAKPSGFDATGWATSTPLVTKSTTPGFYSYFTMYDGVSNSTGTGVWVVLKFPSVSNSYPGGGDNPDISDGCTESGAFINGGFKVSTFNSVPGLKTTVTAVYSFPIWQLEAIE